MRFSILLLSLLIVSACSSSQTPGTSPSPAAPTVSSLVITGTATLSGVGQTSQLTATATFSDGTTQNVTTSVTWQSSNTNLATVSSNGLVTAAGTGTLTITATYQGKSATYSIVVSFSTSTRSTMTAVIDGVAFNAITVSTVRTQLPTLPSGLLGIGGANGFSGTYLVLTIAVPAAAGTYQLGPNSIPNGSLHQNNASSSIVWDTLVAGGSGTITVTAVTATGASGTFALTLVPNGGVGGTPTGTKNIVNGVFNVTF